MTEENWADLRDLIALCEENNIAEDNYYITVFIENGKPRFATTYKTPPFYCGVE